MRSLIANTRGRALLVAALSTGALVAAALVAGGAGAAGPQVITLGQTSNTPPPSCPATGASDCQAVGKVTGFQVKANGQKNLFKAPANGHIINWSIRLSQPSSTPPAAGKPSEIQFFNDFYGSPPKAGIAILHRKGSTSPPKLRLKRQGPVEDLTDYMSAKKNWTTFVLPSPGLKVKKGDIVALTIPTWAPAFAVNVAADNVWRASRGAKKCNGASNIKLSRPQTAVGTTRKYGCAYKAARLLYTAGFIAG
jgi:hypothetical protein